MNNLGKIKNGDKVAILGLSDGILGEDFVAHEIALLEKGGFLSRFYVYE